MKVGIIGSGISGLYSALLLKKNGIDDVRIFEEHDIIGGRIKNIRFEGMSVVAGAGVGVPSTRSNEELSVRAFAVVN